jgi:hypothetical protein
MNRILSLHQYEMARAKTRVLPTILCAEKNHTLQKLKTVPTMNSTMIYLKFYTRAYFLRVYFLPAKYYLSLNNTSLK